MLGDGNDYDANYNSRFEHHYDYSWGRFLDTHPELFTIRGARPSCFRCGVADVGAPVDWVAWREGASPVFCMLCKSLGWG